MESKKYRILVCGGRDFDDITLVQDFLSKMKPIIGVIIHGDCEGADYLAGLWAQANKIPVEVYPVTKEEWDKFGRAAGPMRNTKMLIQGKPDICFAFPGGTGTANMIKQALDSKCLTLQVGHKK